jgi:phosphohistidine phosphatase
MKTVLLMRHAKSSWADSRLADHERPLNRRGRGDAPRMGAFLAQQELIPDRILCSSAVRTRQTAEGLFEGLGQELPITYTRDLYGGSAGDFVEALKRLGDEIEMALIIAHNPGMEYALEQFTGQWERLPTACIAQVEFGIDSWSDLNEETQGELKGLWRPKEIK